jgi:energy-coupling factor transporter ATP-binding protein EcfA2
MRSLPNDLISRVLASHPAPIADAVFALEAAENLHERRDRVVEVFRTILRLLSTMALAVRLQRGTGGGDDTAHVRELLCSLRQRGLTDGQWLELTRELLRPWSQAPVGHPVPGFVELVHGKERKQFAENTSGLLEMRKSETIAHGKTGDTPEVIAFLEDRLPQVDWLLQALDPIWGGARLVVPRTRPDAAEDQQRAFDMTGLRSGNKWRPFELATGVRILPGEPVFVDAVGKPLVALNPVAQWRKPTPDVAEELFLLEGGDRKGAVFRSYPACSEHVVPEVWAVLETALGTGSDVAGPVVAGETRPFRGLESFERRHAALFFGREQEAEALANRIRKSAIVTVTGPSGAGKTSLLQAGVLPHLDNFEAVSMRPGADPLAALVQQLRQSLQAWPDLEEALGKLKARPESLGESLLQWVTWKRRDAKSDSQSLLLVVDQTEELFTLCRMVDARRNFAVALASLAPNDSWPTHLVLSIRGDFFTNLSDLAPLQGLYNREIEVVSRPGPEALARTLTEPARLFGFRFEDRQVVDTMVQAVAHVPSALALLQFCADRMWDQRDRAFNQLTWNSYRSMNGVEGGIAEHAERMFSELSESQQMVARSLFVRLVTEDKTRAVIAHRELLSGQPPDAEAVLNKLVCERLVSVREDADKATRIELVHEALITHWPRFLGWLDEDLEWVLVHKRVAEAAKRWVAERRTSEFLLREGKELGEGEALAHDRGPMLSEPERSLIAASQTANVRRRNVRRIVMGGIMLLAALATGLALFARSQAQVALAGEREARHNLATTFDERAASSEGRGLVREAEMYRAIALNTEDSAERRAAYWDARRFGVAMKELRHQGPGHHEDYPAVFDPDGALLATLMDNGAIELLDIEKGKVSQVFKAGEAARAVCFLDVRTLASAGLDEITLWDITSGKAISTHTMDAIRRLRQSKLSPEADRNGADWESWGFRGGRPVFSEDCRMLTSLVPDGTTRLWDVTTGQEMRTFSSPGDFADREGQSRLPHHHRTQRQAGLWASVLTFSPDGLRVASSDTEAIRVWDVSTGREILSRPHPKSPLALIRSLAFSTDGGTLVIGGDGLWLWKWRIGLEVEELSLAPSPGSSDTFTQVAFLRDGTLVSVDTNAINRTRPTDHVLT